MVRFCLAVAFLFGALGAFAQYTERGTILIGEDPGVSRGCGRVSGGSVPGAEIQYQMTQNGDDPAITVTVRTEGQSTITSATITSFSSVGWLADQAHASTEISGTPETTHVLTFAASDVQLWDTDELVCSVTFGDASTLEVRKTISFTPAPVDVLHDGYIAGGFMQNNLKYLAPGEFGYSLDGQIETWEEFGQSFDSYLIGQHALCEAEDDSPQLLIDHILPNNHDFVPTYFLYFGWAQNTTYQPATFGQIMEDYFLTDDYKMKDYTGADVMVDWGPTVLNPTGFTVTDGDTLWQTELYAQMVYEMVSHSSNYVANMSILFDYAQDTEMPWFQATTAQWDWDLDNDGIPYLWDHDGDPGTSKILDIFSPGGVEVWGHITELDAYLISVQKCYAWLKELMPDIEFSWNGQWGTERSDPSFAGYKDFAMLERWRDVDSSSEQLRWLYGPTWRQFLDLCGDYSNQYAGDLPWNHIHWDTRENLVERPRAGTDNLTPLMTNMGEGAALLGNGVTSFAFIDREGNPSRYSTSIDPVAAGLDLGVPDGPIVEDSWGRAHRMWTKGRVDIEWGGAFRAPVPYGWKVSELDGTVLRSVGMDSFPMVDDAMVICTYAAENRATTPDWIEINDITRVVAAYENHGHATIRPGTPDENFDDYSGLIAYNSAFDDTEPIGSVNTMLCYVGLDDILANTTVQSASLNLTVAWVDFNLEAGDKLYFCAITDPGMGQWLIDREHTTWNNPSPGLDWPTAPETWVMDDFGPVVEVEGPVSVASGEAFDADLTPIVEYAASGSPYYGFAMIYNRADGSGGSGYVALDAPRRVSIDNSFYFTVDTRVQIPLAISTFTITGASEAP